MAIKELFRHELCPSKSSPQREKTSKPPQAEIHTCMFTHVQKGAINGRAWTPMSVVEQKWGWWWRKQGLNVPKCSIGIFLELENKPMWQDWRGGAYPFLTTFIISLAKENEALSSLKLHLAVTFSGETVPDSLGWVRSLSCKTPGFYDTCHTVLWLLCSWSDFRIRTVLCSNYTSEI